MCLLKYPKKIHTCQYKNCYYLSNYKNRHKDGKIMMHKKLRQLGNSWGLVIPKAILEGLRINPVLDEISLYIENDSVVIKKYKKENEET